MVGASKFSLRDYGQGAKFFSSLIKVTEHQRGTE